MTNPIDTTKAPKGATHYLLRDGHPQWRKNADNRWYAWSSCWAVWVVISGEVGPYVAIPRPLVGWNGEGLPPVGTVCEFRELGGGEWHKAMLMYISNHTAIMRFADSPDDNEAAYSPLDLEFRPFTDYAEISKKIEAEKRELQAKDLYHTMILGGVEWDDMRYKDDFYRAIDAGYRKRESK